MPPPGPLRPKQFGTIKKDSGAKGPMQLIKPVYF